MKKLISFVVALLCGITCAFSLVACGDGGNGSGSGSGNTVAVTGVTLNKSSLTLVVGDEETLIATVSPDDATDKSVTWSSDNASVATVEGGKVKAEAVGTAKITATAGGKKAECTVSVSAPAAKLSEDEWQACIAAFVNGENFSLKREVNDEIVAAMQLEGTTYYELVDGDKSIFVKDGNLYYWYKLDKGDEVWSKNISSASRYYSRVFYAQELVSGAATVVAGSYSSFTYAAGKYTAANLHIDDGFDLKDMEITVSGTSLQKVICTWVGVDGAPDELVTVYDIGSTDIQLPETYTDNASTQYYQVSEYQWIEALNAIRFENVTATFIYNKEIYLIKTDINEEGAYYIKDGANKEIYYYYSDNTIYSFVRENGDKLFTRRVKEAKANFGDFIDDFLSLEPFTVINLGKSYGNFEFNSDKNLYIGNNIDLMGEIWNIELKFENKKLVSANFTSDTEFLTVTYSDYNSTVVEVPTDYTEGNSQDLPDGDISIEELLQLAANAVEKNYTKVNVTRDDGSEIATETYYYGTEDWDKTTEGMPLTADDLQNMVSSGNLVLCAVNGGNYELVFRINLPSGFVLQGLVLNADFYPIEVSVNVFNDEEEEVSAAITTYDWGYAD